MNTSLRLDHLIEHINTLVKSIGHDPIPDFWDNDMKIEAIQNYIIQLQNNIQTQSDINKTLEEKNQKMFALAREYAVRLKNLGQETYISTQAIEELVAKGISPLK